MNRLLASIAFLIVSAATQAQPASSADLAMRSRAILAKHCAECHGDKPTRSKLSLLDHAQLTKKRPVAWVEAKVPTASQVLELIEEGSMPPGNLPKVAAAEIDTLREWIASGAAEYPVRFDDEYAYGRILADVENAGEASANYRYLTLHHLARDGSIADFAPARKKFLADAASVFKPTSPPVHIDATQTIFRIDLQKAGWHHQPFKTINDKGEEGDPVAANLFDLVLLEYPYGEIPENSPAFNRLTGSFLQAARQVRPFAFVRGDWFARAATTAPLAEDLRELIKLHDPVPPGLSRPNPARNFPKIDRTLPAIDAWHGNDPEGENAIKGFKVQTIDFSFNKPRSKFSPNDQFRLRVSAEQAMYYQVIWIDSKGKIDTRTNVESYEVAGGARNIVLPFEGGLGDELGRERLIVFASPKPFPAPIAWRATHETRTFERFVHPIFPLKKQGDGFVVDTSDAQLTRRTVYIDIAAAEKK